MIKNTKIWNVIVIVLSLKMIINSSVWLISMWLWIFYFNIKMKSCVCSGLMYFMEMFGWFIKNETYANLNFVPLTSIMFHSAVLRYFHGRVELCLPTANNLYVVPLIAFTECSSLCDYGHNRNFIRTLSWLQFYAYYIHYFLRHGEFFTHGKYKNQITHFTKASLRPFF